MTATNVVVLPVRVREVPAVVVDVGAPAGRVVQASIANGLARLLRHEEGARSGDDAEDVHQARVATRRLRSDLRTFRPLADEEWVAGIRDELKWLAGELGAVRDADVLLQRLEEQATALPVGDHQRARALLGRLADQRDAARASLLTALDSARYTDLVVVLHRAVEAPRLTPKAEKRAASVLPALVARAWGHLEQTVKELPDDPADAELHKVRIRAKRARYAAEAAAPVVGKPARRFAAAVARVQSVLGDLQDATVAEEWLRDASSTARGATGVVAGELVAAQRLAMVDARRQWPDAWKKASRKKLRAWLA